MNFGAAEREMEAHMIKKLSALAFAVASMTALTSEAQAQRVWKHGMVEAKSDAGFVFMAEKGGFAEKNGIKLESIKIDDLGKAIPDHDLGVSVCLPLWKHVIGYEEGDQEIVSKFKSGYPRFCCPPAITRKTAIAVPSVSAAP